MCFSVEASFVTAGVTAAIGIVSLTRVTRPREVPLAAAPILFAMQQSIEGLLWLNLPLAPDGSISTGLTLLFLFFAQVLWPIYAPITVMLIEPSETRRRLMLPCFAAGAAVAAYLLWWILARPHVALILDRHIVYVTEHRHSGAVPLAYLAATSLPLMLSSQRTLVTLGTIILVGCTIACAFYWHAFVSVWCFFAAAASAVILCHFEWARRQRLRIAGA
jgi:Family of unknown function (DUF6629)